MADVHEVLADLRALLDKHGRAWYVFGAQAVVVYGRPRQTADIDVTLSVPPDALSRLTESLEDYGFSVTVDDIESFAERTRVIPVVHEASKLPVDLILAGPGLEQEFLVRAKEISVGTARVPFISPEDLVAIKILAGRTKDLEDVRGILAKQGASLDKDRIRDVLMRLERALDRSDLVSMYERLEEIGEGPDL